jgi:hemerythrin-like domain-containing protein
MIESCGGTQKMALSETLQELNREHDFVRPLLDHLSKMSGQRMGRNLRDPRSIRIGVALLDAYLHRVHALREDRETLPQVSTWEGLASNSELNIIRDIHAEMRGQAGRLLRHLSQWKAGDLQAGLSSRTELSELVARDRVTIQNEDSQILDWLSSAGTERGVLILRDGVDQRQGSLGALERRIHQYLEGRYST